MAKDYVQEQIIESSTADFSSRQAEEAVIGIMLTDGRIAEENVSALTDKDFYFADNGKIYRGIQAAVAKRQSVDLITVDAALGELFPLELAGLSAKMVGMANAKLKYGVRGIDNYIRIVKDLSTRRKSIHSFEGIMAMLKDPTRDIAEILDHMRAETGQISVGKHKWESIQDVLLATYDYLEKRQQGQVKAITTGIGNIDGLIGGFFAGELTIIGARPSVGKSAFGANIALCAARRGFHVAIVSREMSNIQYGSRVMSREAWVDGMRLRKGEIDADDWGRIAECMGDLGGLPIDFMFTVRTVEDLCIEVQRKVECGELDMLVVDYLQLMETRKRFDKDNLRVGYISATLKNLAMDCNIPVIALAQVGRDAEGSMPTLKNLKDSGNIEQDADGVIFLHRPISANDEWIDRRDRDSFDVYQQKGLTYLCIGVAKQRQGAIGKACVLFEPAFMRYIEIDRSNDRPNERSANHGTESQSGQM